MRTWHLVLAISFVPASPVLSQSPTGNLATTLRALDANFVCPERLASDEARRAELASFGRTLAARRLSYAQAMKVRLNFLARHNCGRGQIATADASAVTASSGESAVASRSAPTLGGGAAIAAPVATALIVADSTSGLR